MTVSGEAALHGGCVLCKVPDFLRGGFGERTMIICDQCEREYHIGCLAEHGRAHLTELPEGKASLYDILLTLHLNGRLDLNILQSRLGVGSVSDWKDA